MGTHSPLQIALLIVAGLATVGVVVTYLRTRMTFAGYEEIIGDIRRLRASLHGELFRDGSDVVVSGTWEKNPVVVRFSNQESTPGLNIRMPAPATFQISVAPAGTTVTEGPRTPVKTADDAFDARFTTRTDQPTQARMLLGRQVTSMLQKLACTKNTYIAIGAGMIEQSELIIPSPETGKHVMEHLKQMAALATSLHTLPGSEKVKVVTFERERHVFARVVMAVGVMVAVASIIAAIQVPPRNTMGANESLSNGILPADADLIGDAPSWHAASAAEMDAGGVEFLRSFGIPATGRVEGDFSGTANGQDAAYLLINADNKRRVVIISGHQKAYDAQYPAVAVIARVPKSNLPSVVWKNDKGPGEVAGDGLLVVRQPGNLESGVVVFLMPEGVKSALPKAWSDVPLK